jgi:hypothetical protein
MSALRNVGNLVGCYLEDNTAAGGGTISASIATGRCRSVKIPVSVEYQWAIRICPIAAAMPRVCST